MKLRALRLLWISSALLAAVPSFSATPVHYWSRPIGSLYSGTVSDGVATDAAGNVIIVGRTQFPANLGGGPLPHAGDWDVILGKYDSAGNHLWSKSFGDPNLDWGFDVATDPAGNIYIVGYFVGAIDFGGGPLLVSAGQQDIFVASFDPSGAHLWSKRFGSPVGEESLAIAVGGGQVYITGYFSVPVDFGGGALVPFGGYDLFVAAYTLGGAHMWSKRFGDADFQNGIAIGADASGAVVVAGWVYGTIDFGFGTLTSAGLADIFVAKFDAAGVPIWSGIYGDVENESVYDVDIDGAGNVVMCGNFQGSIDFGGGPITATPTLYDAYLVKFNTTGAHLWTRHAGNASSLATTAQGLSIDTADNVVITGWMQGPVDFGGGTLPHAGAHDVFYAMYDAAGAHRCSQSYGDFNSQWAAAIAFAPSGAFAVTGFKGQGNDLGGGTLTDESCFVALYGCEEPVPVLIQQFAAAVRGTSVTVQWRVAADEAIDSYQIERRTGTSAPTVVAAGAFDARVREWTDERVTAGETYAYTLVLRTRAGEEIRSVESSVRVTRSETALAQNFPNPFNPRTTVAYSLAEQSAVVISIYDAGGVLVTRLDQGVRGPGQHHVEWDGRDNAGRAVGSGVYFYRLEGAGPVATRKMVLLK